MKRDKRLILKILKHAREHCTGDKPIGVPHFEGYDPDFVNYHVGLCYQADYLEVLEIKTQGPTLYRINNLTWAGHEALDANNVG